MRRKGSGVRSCSPSQSCPAVSAWSSSLTSLCLDLSVSGDITVLAPDGYYWEKRSQSYKALSKALGHLVYAQCMRLSLVASSYEMPEVEEHSEIAQCSGRQTVTCKDARRWLKPHWLFIYRIEIEKLNFKFI